MTKSKIYYSILEKIIKKLLRKDDASLKDNLDDVNNSSNLVLSFTFEEVKEIFLIFFKNYHLIRRK